MPQSKKPAVRVLRVGKGASLKTIYEKSRRAFTADDLQRFTEVEEGIPADDVLKSLQELDRLASEKRKRKKKNGH